MVRVIESALLSDVPRNRVADLTARKDAGTLTSAERLALCVLAGGRLGEEAADKLIDAALEEYGTGGYRVPVRVVGDPARLRLVVTFPDRARREDVDHVARRFLEALNQPGPTVFVADSGASVQAFEVGAGGADVSVVRGASNG